MSPTEIQHRLKSAAFEARTRPALYRFKLLCFVFFGYFVIFATVVTALALLAGICWIIYQIAMHPSGLAIRGLFIVVPIAFGLIVFCASTLGALQVKLPDPTGITLERGVALTLYREIDRLRETMAVPPFEAVFIDTDFNAGILQIPRYGIFGFQKNYLQIGLPLLLALDQQQFRAVLAHEMAHISRKHSAFGNWIHRIQNTWPYLLEALRSEDNRGRYFFYLFCYWYVPRLNIATFGIDRQNEYEADRIAADEVGSKQFGEMLCALNIHGAALELGTTVPLSNDDCVRLLNEQLSLPDPIVDPHPCLRNRLGALGEKAALPDTVTNSAAQTYFGDRLDKIAEQVGIRLRRNS